MKTLMKQVSELHTDLILGIKNKETINGDVYFMEDIYEGLRYEKNEYAELLFFMP